jgi:DNA-directed RNA polymerase specialized sigma24 family protein
VSTVERPQAAALFPKTRWTLVLAARGDPAQRRVLLDELIRPRWRPLYVLARKCGLDATAADDAVQSFLARLLEPNNDFLARLDPSLGSLRAYLKTAFRHHLTNLRERERAAKRGAGAKHTDVNELEEWLATPVSVDALYDRAWALAVFEEAMTALEAEYAQGARRGPERLVRELFAFDARAAYEELATQHGMSVPQLKSFAFRARRRFRELLRESVARTLGDNEDIDAELRRVIDALST